MGSIIFQCFIHWLGAKRGHHSINVVPTSGFTGVSDADCVLATFPCLRNTMTDCMIVT